MALNESCQQTRESWFESFEDDFDAQHENTDRTGEWSAHVESCPDCADFVDKVQSDQKRLRQHFAEAHVPSPARIEFRSTPLHAASGHPRRVSLSILPLLLALLLVLVLAIIAFSWIQSRPDRGGLERPVHEMVTAETASVGSERDTPTTARDPRHPGR